MDPTFDPDRQIEDARASLVAHLGELGRRFKVARARLDVPAQIAAHPLVAVGAALAAGALLGLAGGGRRARARKPREPRAPNEGGLGRAVMAGLGALAIRAAKELALRGAAQAARSLWEQHEQASASEVRTSYDPHMEPFLRH
jgi:hypothetical protein